MPRIWYQSSIEFEGAPHYADALHRCFERVAAADSDIHLSGVPAGTWGGNQPSELFGYPFAFQTLLAGPFIDNALRAERDGFDAYVIGTYIEPFLREIRSAVDIPVISSFEASLLVACSFGHAIGLITLNDHLCAILRTNLKAHGLADKVVAVEAIEPDVTEKKLGQALTAPSTYLELFNAKATAAVEKGADVIIPAEGILAAAVSTAGLSSIRGAAIVDGIGVPVAYAEMLIRLRKGCGMAVGRGSHYAQPPAAMGKWLRQERGLDI